MIPNYIFSEVRDINDNFRTRKRDTEFLSEAYQKLGYDKKSLRVFNCGSFLAFSHEIHDGGVLETDGKLYQANFCKDRLCPTCTWRRSLKIFGQISQIMEILKNEYVYLFLTLTIPNCKPGELQKCMRQMYQARTRLFRRKETKCVHGVISVAEITYNSKSDTMHPHLHNILAVKKSYFSKGYLSNKDWQRLWYEAFYKDILPVSRLVSDPGCMPGLLVVDIRRCKAKDVDDTEILSSAVAEVAKYSVKPGDYIFGDKELTAHVVNYLLQLHGCRMLSFSGVFREAYQSLDLEDAEDDDADLIHINETFNKAVAHLITQFRWRAGCYIFDNSYILDPIAKEALEIKNKRGKHNEKD